MTFAAITTLPKTTHNISTHNTGETSSNYSIKLLLSPHNSSHGIFRDSLTVDLFKTSGWKGDIQPPPSTQFFTKSLAWSEISMNFHLAEYLILFATILATDSLLLLLFFNTFYFYWNLFCYLLTYLFTYLLFYFLLCIKVVNLLSIKKKSSRIDFNPRTYFVRPKTCYCQQ